MDIRKIKVDTNQLESDRKSLKSDWQMIKNDVNSIYQEVQELDLMWDGSANETFKNQFRVDHQAVLDLLDEMARYIGKVNFAISQYESCENSISDLISKIRV